MAEMTETAYLAATNRAKIQMATHIIRDCIFMSDTGTLMQTDAIKAIRDLEHLVSVDITSES